MLLPFLLAMNFNDFTYQVSPCSGNVPPPIKMQGGSYSYADTKMGQSFDLSVNAVHEGSMQPGTKQAVVVLECDFPIGGTATAYLYDERNGMPVYLAEVGHADWGGDWGAPPSSIHVTFKNDHLYVDACKDDECSLYVVTTYALRNGKLAKVHVQTHKRAS